MSENQTINSACAAEKFTLKEFKSSVEICRRTMRMLDYHTPKEKFVEYEPKDYDSNSPWVLLGFIKPRPKIESVMMNERMIRDLTDAANQEVMSFTYNPDQDPLLTSLYGVPIIENALVPYGEMIQVHAQRNMFANYGIPSFLFGRGS